MLGASCNLELSEIVVTKHRNPEETEEGRASDSSKYASSSVLLTVCEDRMKTMLKVFSCLVQRGVSLTVWFDLEVGYCGHPTCETRINV